jgi:hypothetical protein
VPFGVAEIEAGRIMFMAALMAMLNQR